MIIYQSVLQIKKYNPKDLINQIIFEFIFWFIQVAFRNLVPYKYLNLFDEQEIVILNLVQLFLAIQFFLLLITEFSQ